MHLDIDAFFASVEQVRNPRLKGKPVIVGTGVIASCSYGARSFGLHAGMSLKRAKRLCPGAIVLDGNHQVYRSFAEKVWEICRGFTPDMTTLLDDAYLDLSGTERLHGPLKSMARRLKALVHRETGLTVTVGLATSRTVSRIATSCDKPDGLVIVKPGDEETFMCELPVEKLPGVGPTTAEVLRKLNITTIGSLSQLPRWSLEALFGANGAALYERSRGRDSHIISRHEVPQSISRETTFECDTNDRNEIEGMLHYLTERAMKTLRDLGLVMRTVTAKIRYADFEGETASKGLPRDTDLDNEVFALARRMLQRLYRRRVSLRSIGVRLSNFQPASQEQPELFDEKDRRRSASLYRVLDEVRNRYGYSSIITGRSLDLLAKMTRDDYGFVLRTPSLTK